MEDILNLFDGILDIFFPHVCGFCGKIDKNGLCESCEKLLIKKFVYGIDSYNDKFFEKHIYIMRYEDIRGKLLDYKFENKSYLYKTFTEFILKSKKVCDILSSCDIICPVPIHKKRKKERGYNQSELISKEIAKNISGLEFRSLIKKVKNNPKQSLLNENERIDNVKNAYEAINKQIINNKQIVLFDDIFTTGNTVNECSRILKQSGAKYILVLSLAK